MSQKAIPRSDMADEIVVFYASTKSTDHSERAVFVDDFEPVVIHWAVKNPRGKLFMREMTLEGDSTLSSELPTTGFKKVSLSSTRDYSLEEVDKNGQKTTLATLRISVFGL